MKTDRQMEMKKEKAIFEISGFLRIQAPGPF
jgi:hypothetical protein